MSFQIPLLGEFFVTGWTPKRLLSVVAEHVPLHAAQSEEALWAQGALVRPLPRVGARVHYEVPLGGKAFATVGAGVGNLARVRPSMKQQLSGGQKRLPAHGAQVILLPSVHLHVSHEAALAESLPTDGAHVAGPFVQLLVLSEGIAAQEALVALAADEFAAPFVDSLVLIIAREADEAFLTLDAAVWEAVQPHVGCELIGKFKHLFTLGAFGVSLRKVFVHWSCNQKPSVHPWQRSLLPSFLVVKVALFGASILFSFPPACDFLLLRLWFPGSDGRIFFKMFHDYLLFVVAQTLGVDIYVCVRYTRESQNGPKFTIIVIVIAAGWS